MSSPARALAVTILLAIQAQSFQHPMPCRHRMPQALQVSTFNSASEIPEGVSRRQLFNTLATATITPATMSTLGIQSAGAVDALTVTDSGLEYFDVLEGQSKAIPKDGSTVKIDFEGWLGGFDGKTFTKGSAEAVLDSGALIPGINEALKSMRVGTTRRLKVNPELGYGAKGFPTQGDTARTLVPPDTTIYFQIRLRSIKAVWNSFS